MSLDISPHLYSQWFTPLESVVNFFKDILTELGWDSIDENDVIMDVGCGPGVTTKEVILPFFPKVRKIIAMDVLPDMISIAKEKNAHPRIEYAVADISEWSTLEQWEEKISKVVSIHCFQWVKYPEEGFRNIYRLLKSGGEALLYFPLQASLFDVAERLQNSSKWEPYLKGRENRIPDSHRLKYDANYYKKFLGEMGFEILYCTADEKFQVCASEEISKHFCASLCVLEPYIPREHKEDFKNAIIEEIVKIGGRNDAGSPRHVGRMLEMIVKKK